MGCKPHIWVVLNDLGFVLPEYRYLVFRAGVVPFGDIRRLRANYRS